MAAIDPIYNGESGASVRAKLNELIDTVNSGSTTINVGDAPLFDPNKAGGYEAGSIISYKNESSPDPEFQEFAIYLALDDIPQGVSPEDSADWKNEGATVEVAGGNTANGVVQNIDRLRELTGMRTGHSVTVEEGGHVYVFNEGSEAGVKPFAPGIGSWELKYTKSVVEWQPGTYRSSPTLVIRNNAIYRLTRPVPYESTDFEAEAAAAIPVWTKIQADGVELGETSTTAYRGDRGKIAYDHSQAAHAPANAQKNSDITKSEIEAKLVGNITTHSHTVTKDDVGLGSVENKSSSDIRSEITDTNVISALGFTPMDASLKGTNNGVAELDAAGKVPAGQLPSYVDDVLEFASLSAFPSTGESGKIYTATDTNIVYRWGGTGYVEISPTIALGETNNTAYRGDRGKTAYDHSQAAHAPANAQKNSDITKGEIEAKLTGVISTHSHTVTKDDVGLENVDNTSDLNKPISTATQTALNTKLDITVFNNLEIGGRNLIIRKTEVADTWIDSSGNIVAHANHDTSDFIPVKAGSYMFSRLESALVSSPFFRWAWYDSDKIYIDRQANSATSFPWTPPSGAAFVRISYPTDCSPKFERGNKATDWTPSPEDVDAAIDTAIDNIEIGGRNYALNTSTPKTKSSWTGANNQGMSLYVVNVAPEWEVGKQVTIAFDVEVSGLAWSGGTARLAAQSYGNVTSYDGFGYKSFFSSGSQSSGSGQSLKTRVVYQVTLTAAMLTNQRYTFSVRCDYITAGIVTIKNFALFYGNKATDWTPALEDQVSDWNESDVNSFAFIKNKPSLKSISGKSYWFGTQANYDAISNKDADTIYFIPES